MDIIKKIKTILVWILAITVVLIVIALLVAPWIMLKTKNKKLVLTPKVQIVDITSKDSGQLEQFTEAVTIGKKIIEKLD